MTGTQPYTLWTAPGFDITHAMRVVDSCVEAGIRVASVKAVVARQSLNQRARNALANLKREVKARVGAETVEVEIEENFPIMSMEVISREMAADRHVVLDLGGGMRVIVVYMLLTAQVLYAAGKLESVKAYALVEGTGALVELPQTLITSLLNPAKAILTKHLETLEAIKKVILRRGVRVLPRHIAKELKTRTDTITKQFRELEKLGILMRRRDLGYQPTELGKVLLEATHLQS